MSIIIDKMKIVYYMEDREKSLTYIKHRKIVIYFKKTVDSTKKIVYD